MLNIKLFHFFNSFAGQSSWGDKAIIFTADILPIVLIILAVFFLFWHIEKKEGESDWSGFRRKAGEIALVFIVSAAAWAISTLLKNMIHHPRPYAMLEGVHKLFSPDDPYSFPSGHATFFAALATAIYFYHRRLGLIFGLGALLIGLARVASGIHFPSDILTGFGLGILVAGTVAYLRKKA
jgi:undecaprenyl-diphosphatase